MAVLALGHASARPMRGDAYAHTCTRIRMHLRRRTPPCRYGCTDRSFGGLAGEEEIPMPGLRRQNGNFDLRQGDEIAILGEDPI